MIPTLFLLFVHAVLGNPSQPNIVQRHHPCVLYDSVCAPAHALQQGCTCALIRPGQQISAHQSLQQLLVRQERDTFTAFRFLILPQNAIDELNRVFPIGESARTSVDSNVFAKINTEVHDSLMTVPKSLLHIVVNMQSNWLSPESLQKLQNCDKPRCLVSDVTDLLDNPKPTRQDRKFRVTLALRYDIEGADSLIAIASASSDFVLNKLLVQWEEKRGCRKQKRSRYDLRVFDESAKKNWLDHVNHEMVRMFRINNENLLV